MRWFLRGLLLYTLALFLLDRAFSFVSVLNLSVLVATALVLFMLNTIGKPILKVLWLPINIITLGLFSWVIHIIVVFLATILVPGFIVTNFDMPSIQIGKLLIPHIHLSMILTYFLFSFLLSQSVAVFRWVLVDSE